ncbi:MAG: carboxypeptidase-like regulatory domain-containing protein [Pirellulales bacterium]|nr:carboxypeptidase-like regulatory domain-containing protein [Pirellulales bacterium]
MRGICKKCIATVCCVALLVASSPQVVAYSGPAVQYQRPKEAKFVTYDVALDTRLQLKGQLTDASGVALQRAPVVLYQGKTHIASTRTDHQGRFAIAGVSGGVYQLFTVGRQATVRSWTEGAAPPGAGSSLLVVSDYRAVRGQYDLNSVLHSGVIPIILVTVGAIAIPIIVSDNKDSSS